LRRRSATFLYALWLLIVVRLVLPPGFAFPTGWGWWLRPQQVAVSSETGPTAQPTDGLRPQLDRLADTRGAAPASPEGRGALSLSVLLMIGWLGIVAARCGMLLTAGLQLRVWVSRARPILDPTVLGLLEESRRRVGVRRTVQLRNSESCATPLVVGVWRPVLLLPSAVLERLNSHQLRAVLIHELYHVKRWDGAVNLLQGILGAVYFFHPLVWWANRRIRQLREDACDERTVAALEGRRKPYGEAIFKVAEILGYAAPPLALGVLDSKAPLAQRLRRILDPRLPAAARFRWTSALAVVAAGAILIPSGARRDSTAGMTLAPQAPRTVVREPITHIVEETGRSAIDKTDQLPPEALDEPAPGAPPAEADRLDEVLADLASGDTRRADGAFRRLIAMTGQRATMDDRLVDALARQLSVPQRRAAAVDVLVSVGPVAEPAVLRTLDESDQATRTAIYGVLRQIGAEASILALQRELLERSEGEQRRAKRALDSIYGRIKGTPSEPGSTVNSVRIFK
jgi:beta-lactamase regulating signal transducer with metallopeptidase domain